jgi:hypothetical protein
MFEVGKRRLGRARNGDVVGSVSTILPREDPIRVPEIPRMAPGARF